VTEGIDSAFIFTVIDSKGPIEISATVSQSQPLPSHSTN
jgi:hypothetical protein